MGRTEDILTASIGRKRKKRLAAHAKRKSLNVTEALRRILDEHIAAPGDPLPRIDRKPRKEGFEPLGDILRDVVSDLSGES